MRNIIEQVIEWNANLYVCFVDFEKAFDSIDKGIMSKGNNERLRYSIKIDYNGKGYV